MMYDKSEAVTFRVSCTADINLSFVQICNLFGWSQKYSGKRGFLSMLFCFPYVKELLQIIILWRHFSANAANSQPIWYPSITLKMHWVDKKFPITKTFQKVESIALIKDFYSPIHHNLIGNINIDPN